MNLVFAATAAEAAAYARQHRLEDFVTYSDLAVALTGFRIQAGDEIFLLPSVSDEVVQVIQRQAASLRLRPRIHRPLT